MNAYNRLQDFLARHLPPAVRMIFTITIGVFLVTSILKIFARGAAATLIDLLVEDPLLSLSGFQFWRLGTYIFVHGNALALVFNMLLMWFFAPELERRWGTRRFWGFYLTTGVGAGLAHALIFFLTGAGAGIMFGSAGIMFAIMGAYAAYYPNRLVYFWGVFPIPVKYLVAILIFLNLSTLADYAAGASPAFTHLLAIGIGYLWMTRHHHTPDFNRWRYTR